MLDAVFSACSTAALLGWVLLAVAPRWKATGVVAGVVLPVGLGLVYLTLIVFHLPGARGGFGSLADVAALFEQPALLLAGWIHYLAFDLFIGAWEVRDARRHLVPHLLVVPCLVLTFLLGPIGLLCYLGLRWWRSRDLALVTS
jgi:hypothetical protein